MLNKKLLETQKVTSIQIKRLEELHEERKAILNYEKNMTKEQAKNSSEYLVDYMESIEFRLQENWNFDKNQDYHTHWNTFKNCSCPKIDNMERVGRGRIINTSCVFHGF